MTTTAVKPVAKPNSVFAGQKRYKERQQSKSRCRVNVWVPEEYRDELREIASAMRDGSWEDEI